jgi:CRP-like cAMP-binding protein
MTMFTELAGFPVLARLTPAQHEFVAGLAHEVAFEPGERVFEEGQLAVGCWLLRSGRVSLSTSVPSRGEVVLQTLGAGDVLGWSWLVPPHVWRFGATADQRVAAFRLDTAQLKLAAERDPALGYAIALGLLESVTVRLSDTRARLLDLYRNSRDRRP